MKFHERFDIEVGIETAQRRFINRIHISLILDFFFEHAEDFQYHLKKAIAYRLGENDIDSPIHDFLQADFLRNLQVIEAFRGCFENDDSQNNFERQRERVDDGVCLALSQSEIDLGIEWKNGGFIRTGATLLDQGLVNDTLRWLRAKGYENVLKPFEKGLRNLLHAHFKTEGFPDVITEMYKAVEALAKIVTGRPEKDLSGNRELFLSKVNASDSYKVLLKNYIEYANLLRHAEKPSQPKPILSEREVESFVYLTGIFIRLAMP